jgi:exodeoxyribonuclease V alpha subunit
MEKFGWQFRLRDKVIRAERLRQGRVQWRHRPDREGRSGRTRGDDPLRPAEVVYDYGEMDEIALASAIMIHKSQGSEFPAVVVPVAMQQYTFCSRGTWFTPASPGASASSS